MQQRLQTHILTDEGRKSSLDIISPLREMYQLRRNVMKLEKQRTDESCHRKSEEFIKNISQSHRDVIIPQHLKFEDNLDGSMLQQYLSIQINHLNYRATIHSINSVAQNYEIIKPNIHYIDWNKENQQNQSNKYKHHQKSQSNKNQTKFLQLDNYNSNLILFIHNVNKLIKQFNKYCLHDQSNRCPSVIDNQLMC